ncbi:ortholog of sugar beet HS1 PRO-1 2 [Actinidia rufa]|uniref:Ortholog of sugar beet HS1 PRO-1 2 n=1 Tax=Actinidia rufa TaxID=165716 RepID=A0A7J0EDK7_9ERIC|nr:ortholog of sugar beet HS1 PRO-1 2 [Actinidia rufa]
MVDLECKAKIITSNSPIKSPKLSTKLKIGVPPAILVDDLSPTGVASVGDHVPVRFDSVVRSEIVRESEGVEETDRVARDGSDRARGVDLRGRRDTWQRADRRSELVGRRAGSRGDSLAEVWKLSKETTVVSRTSEASLLPRLATWQKSEEVAQKILYSIECEMRRCPYTLGLGEPNLAGKPSFDYDLLCKPSDLQALKKSPSDLMNLQNHENQTLYSTHQILESWIYVSQQLLKRIVGRIDSKDFDKASTDCWLLERTWKLLSEIEDLHLLMDPDDFLRLKNQLLIKSSSESEPFCFRSRGLTEITKLSKDLRHNVPFILCVEVDPKGGPRIQEAAMRLYRKRIESEKIHLLQALQAIESALKRFYYAYKQLIVNVMGSLEAKGNQAFVTFDSSDSLAQIFLESTYFPSLDAAKTFLGHEWSHQRGQDSSERRKQGHK